ncbi:MAG: zinc ABC transporter substrate-binding protein [Patescibacteria group bacterium]|jgi:zinc transport system substrate-binding protein
MKRIYKYAVLFASVVVVVCFLALLTNNAKPRGPSDKLQVSTSFYPLYFFASEIGGSNATVYNITPVGVEPHDYEPTAQDIARIENNDLLILNGKGLESWGNRFTNSGSTKAHVAVVGEIDATSDPHVWLDPNLARIEVQKIADAYTKVDPAYSNDYISRTEKLLLQLDELDKEFTDAFKNCSQKNFVTSHEAFGYLAKAYGLKQVPIAGLSPDAEPSSQQLARVAKFAKDNNLKFIFFESLVSPKLAETIAQEVAVKTLVLDPLEGISDTDSAAGKNYFTVMRQNLLNLRTALSCK